MAKSKSSTTKKSTSSSKTGSRSGSAKKQAAPPAGAKEAPPIRREVTGVIFLLIAVLLVIGYFNTEGTLVAAGSRAIKTLVGYGFWLSAPAFLFSAIILIFHHGRPVALRVFCILMLPLLFGAMGHVLYVGAPPEELELQSVLPELAREGQFMASGGVLGGLLGYLLYRALSKAGALIVLLAVFGVFLTIGTKFDAAGAAGRLKERAMRQYEPEPEPVRPTRPATPVKGRAQAMDTVSYMVEPLND